MIYFIFLLYAIAFWIVAFRRPHIALMLIFAFAPFQHDLSAGGPLKFSIAEINLLLTLPIFFVKTMQRGKRLSIGPIAVPLSLYLLVCLVSSVLSWHGSDTLTSLMQTVLYLVIAVLIFSSFAEREEDLEVALKGLVRVGVFLAV